MTNIKNGMVAGFVATIVLSIMMMAKAMMGVMPELNPIQMMASMMAASAAMGWIAHFAIGTIAWGGGFAVLNRAIPGKSQVVKGIVFGVGAWLMMMVAVMPMAGAGLFGLNLGMPAPIMTLVMHIAFGAVLGRTYEVRTEKPQPGTVQAALARTS